MKRGLHIVIMALMAVVLGSCSLLMTSYGSNDLYRTNNRTDVANELKAQAEVNKARAEARKAEYEALIAQAEYEAMMEGDSFTSVLADSYESAYARRLYGFTSPTYRMPSSYYNLATNDAVFYATAYDPAFYNVMVSGDQVWVEPKYITSMFGLWGATNVTFGIYASPWNYGWNRYIDPFYYSWWGYPRYTWYDWNWTICYNPYYDWYWGGYYPGYYPYYPGYYPGYYPPRPPHHRPEHGPHNPTTGPGASRGPKPNYNSDARNSGSRYTSPTTNRNYGSVDGRGNRRYDGAVSTGVNDRRTGATGVGTSRDRNTRNTNYNTSNNAGRSDNFRPTTYDNRSNTSRGTINNNTTNRSGSVSGSASGSSRSGGMRTTGSTSSRR